MYPSEYIQFIEKPVWVKVAIVTAPIKNIAIPSVFAKTNNIPLPNRPSFDKTSIFGIIRDGSINEDLRRGICAFFISSVDRLLLGLFDCGEGVFDTALTCGTEFLDEDLTGDAPL